MRRKLVGLGALVVLTGLVVGAIATSAPAITAARKFTLIARQVEFSRLDFGRSGTSRGDQIIFSGSLRERGGALAGRFDGHCVVTSTPAGQASENRQQCFLTSTIGTANGETEIQAGGVGRLLAEDVILSVTGGTRRFQNVRGQVRIIFRTEDRAVLRYSLIP